VSSSARKKLAVPVVLDLLEPGATCASVAERHGLSANAVNIVKCRVLARLRQHRIVEKGDED
jgi:hypothetical protein